MNLSQEGCSETKSAGHTPAETEDFGVVKSKILKITKSKAMEKKDRKGKKEMKQESKVQRSKE